MKEKAIWNRLKSGMCEILFTRFDAHFEEFSRVEVMQLFCLLIGCQKKSKGRNHNEICELLHMNLYFSQ